jgi:enoyl-CoA hydratase/3-hydroxyacyl-CoA dehydrogenase
MGGSFPVSEDIVFREVARGMERSPKPIFAALNGYALGGGLELALACDFRIAVEGAELGLVEVGIGLIPGAGGTQRLPRIVGIPKAKELILAGRRIKADEAQRIGLVNAVAPRGQLSNVVSEWVDEIKKKSPVAVASAKFSINSVLEGVPLDQGLVLEREYASLNFDSKDRSEGLSALAERRKPEFKGI